jgi:hypothetical protein
MEPLPEPVPASFVKWSRAYLLDPEPGTWSVVAVTAEYAPPWNVEPIAGVTDTVWSGTSSDAMIFPSELIQRTTTPVGPGEVAFMGVLRVQPGHRIDAGAVPEDELQRRITEAIRPGVTSASGFSGWLMRARVVDLEDTSLSNQPADRESFLSAALADLGDSPWAGVVAREGPTTAAAKPQPTVAEPQVPPAAAPAGVATAPAATPGPEPRTLAPEPEPKPEPFPGVPPESPLAKIEPGMRDHAVRRILGDPDDQIDRLTAKAWIPFYDTPDAALREWVYQGTGRVVFSIYKGRLEVVDVVYDPGPDE